ncbi:MAG: hypothetical protein JOZ69_03840, partial [Myxococcales bacterium]|nr:hypothetical protein [Myxococcales bacterium]
MGRPSSSFAVALALACASLVSLSSAPARADVHLSSGAGNHMVVQQGRPVPLSGTDAPGVTVRAKLGSVQATARADSAGRWALVLAPVPAGGPLTLTVEGSNRAVFTDIWSGEVWLASGQSNMELPLARSRGGPAASDDGCPGVHLFLVEHHTALAPEPEPRGAWHACEPTSADAFSAVAFHFAREMHRALGVPIGVIQATWGGTPAEAWTPREALLDEASLRPMLEAMDRAVADTGRREEIAKKIAAWEAKNFQQDAGNGGEAMGFAREGGGGGGWSPMDIPQLWERTGLEIDGAVWFRREVVLPPDWANRDLALSLGPVDDFDVTYWNGERVGATGAETPQYWTVPRRYTVPARLVRPGKNIVAVRVFDHYGDGGFAGSKAQMWVAPASVGADAGKGTGTGGAAGRVSLAGTWSYKIERRLPPAVADFSTRPSMLGPDDPESPTVLWNAMVAPLAGLPLAGVLWYQGESNAGRAAEYRTLFPAMIRGWRAAWHDPALPFLFVQLPNYDAPGPRAPLGEGDWAELREAQTAALREPRTAMAVTIDIGESGNIHPLNKEEVARRLARWAERVVYHEQPIASGPVFLSAAREGAAMRLRFDPVSSGLETADGEPPKGFVVAGADRVFHPADARVEGSSVVVSSRDVPAPVAVRYAWGNDPVNTLRSQAGLPAAPFRTDDWPASAAA